MSALESLLRNVRLFSVPFLYYPEKCKFIKYSCCVYKVVCPIFLDSRHLITNLSQLNPMTIISPPFPSFARSRCKVFPGQKICRNFAGRGGVCEKWKAISYIKAFALWFLSFRNEININSFHENEVQLPLKFNSQHYIHMKYKAFTTV
jgi:hypothetical protein